MKNKNYSTCPITGVDQIEKATVLGWEVVVKKGEFKVGDLVVYIEIDSKLPNDKEWAAFLAPKKYLVKTIKLRGKISQGLILPISIINSCVANHCIGDDVTGVLGITKHAPPPPHTHTQSQEEVQPTKNTKGFSLIGFLKRVWYTHILRKASPKLSKEWPSFIKKTDEDRVQTIPWLLTKMAGKRFCTTEKLDGQSATYFLKKNKRFIVFFGEKYTFGLLSRNTWRSKNDGSSYANVAEKFG